MDPNMKNTVVPIRPKKETNQLDHFPNGGPMILSTVGSGFGYGSSSTCNHCRRLPTRQGALT